MKKSHIKGLIHEAVNAKLTNEGAMSELDILMDEANDFQDFLRKISADPDFNKVIDIKDIDTVNFLQTMWDESGREGADHKTAMAAEGLIKRLVREELKRLKSSK